MSITRERIIGLQADNDINARTVAAKPLCFSSATDMKELCQLALEGCDARADKAREALDATLPPEPGMTVPNILRDGAETYEQRNALYKDNYKRIGPIMQHLFPNGIPASTPEQWNRFGLWFMAFNKLVRYAMQHEEGGHKDSAHDAMVYSAMLEELT